MLHPKSLLGIGLAAYFGACTSVLIASAEVLSSVIKIDSLVSCVSGFKSFTFNVNIIVPSKLSQTQSREQCSESL